jgi:hypothetical protein
MMHLKLGLTYIDVNEAEKVLEIGDTIPISEFQESLLEFM